MGVGEGAQGWTPGLLAASASSTFLPVKHEDGCSGYPGAPPGRSTDSPGQDTCFRAGLVVSPGNLRLEGTIRPTAGSGSGSEQRDPDCGRWPCHLARPSGPHPTPVPCHPSLMCPDVRLLGLLWSLQVVRAGVCHRQEGLKQQHPCPPAVGTSCHAHQPRDLCGARPRPPPCTLLIYTREGVTVPPTGQASKCISFGGGAADGLGSVGVRRCPHWPCGQTPVSPKRGTGGH